MMGGPSAYNYSDDRYTHNGSRVVKTDSNIPIRIKCYSCQFDDMTRVQNEPGTLAWGSCVLCALFGCWLCCCLPLCMEPLQDSNHYCRKCNTLVARKAL